MGPAAAKKFEMTTRAVQVFIVLVVCLAGVKSDIIINDRNASSVRLHRFLASVMEYPVFHYKCLATFITPSSLLTTASCTLCDDFCKLYIRLVTDQMDDPLSPMYNVHFMKQSPLFNIETREHDFAILYLNHPIATVSPVGLPPENYQFSGVTAYIYKWFKTTGKKFDLLKLRLKAVSNEACSKMMYAYFSDMYLCAYGNPDVDLKYHDQGSPIVIKGDILLGIHSQGIMDNRVAVYQSVFPALDWIWRNRKIPQDETDLDHYLDEMMV